MELSKVLFLLVKIATYVANTLSSLTDPIVQPVTNYLFSQEGCPNADGVCPNKNITYYLYTRETQDSPYQLNPFYPETIKDAKFIEGVPLKVIIHGYTGNKDYSPNMELRPAFFQKGEFNILTVDWSPLAREPCYWEAAHNVDSVGRCTAELLDMVYQTHSEVTIDNTQVLGFSLGAHTAGVVAANIKTGKLPRLTGFDPALPLFDDWTNTIASMIDASDAHFVDVYHTNIGYKGKKAAGGTVDVYFNNGVNQPGCNCNRSCDHVRAVEYFAESINSPVGMWAFACWSWTFYSNGFCKFGSSEDFVQVGQYISEKESGVYFSFTNSKPPYLIPPSTYLEDVNLEDQIDLGCSWIK